MLESYFASLSAAALSLDGGVCIFIFFLYWVADALYALYTLNISDARPMSAATAGFAIHFILAFGVLNYVHNYLYVIPLACGSWVGTYCVVERERRARLHAKDEKTVAYDSQPEKKTRTRRYRVHH